MPYDQSQFTGADRVTKSAEKSSFHVMISALLLLSLLSDTPALDVRVSGRQAPGYFLVSGIRTDAIGLIDNGGYLMHYAPAGPNSNMQPVPSGGVSVFDGNVVGYVVFDDALRPVDTIRATEPYTTDFHEGYRTVNQRFVLLAKEVRTLDLSQEVEGGNPNAQVIGCVIQEFDRRGRKTFEWRSLDHISIHETTSDIDISQGHIDYLHANAVVVDSSGDFILSCRNTDQIIKIDRKTSSIIWRLGGYAARRSDFRFINDTADVSVGFSHQHCPVITRNGEILLFDNGVGKLQPESRAVAYRLNQTLMTATKTWEYRHPEKPLAGTMGSVQELPNGNILIGWGSASNGLVATEVDRAGTIHAELRSGQQFEFPYRVYKAPVSMVAVTRSITSERDMPFSNWSGSTGAIVTPTGFTTSEDITIEHHDYAPHDQAFTARPPCELIPQRWVVQRSAESPNTYTLTLSVAGTVAENDPGSVAVYHRPVEGTGPFSPLESSFSRTTTSVSVAAMPAGEYAIGMMLCAQPALIEPPNNIENSDQRVSLDWTEAIGAEGYELELSTSDDFSDNAVLLRVDRTDTVITDLLHPNTRYYWHVRAIRRPVVGPWTDTWTFTVGTPSSVASPLAPFSLPAGTRLTAYDLQGSELARGIIDLPGQPLFPDLRRQQLFIIAVTPSGGVQRLLINQP